MAVRLLAALMLLLWASPGPAQTFPALTGRVVDAADVLSPAQEAELARKSEALEAQTGRQFVLVTVPDLEGYDISDYGYRLGRAWGIGEKGRDTGILLIAAPSERRVRIEVGYGLEPIMTDALSRRIIQQEVVPRAREGDLAGGLVAAADAIIAQLALPEEEAAARARAARTPPGDEGIPLFGVLAFFLILFLGLRLTSRSARVAKPGGVGTTGPIIIWGPPPGSWGGGGRRSGWGGGGFGGGGGSFGGGGASGGW